MKIEKQSLVSIEKSNRTKMVQYFFSALKWDFRIILNKGVWNYFLIGILGLSINPIKKFKKVTSK